MNIINKLFGKNTTETEPAEKECNCAGVKRWLLHEEHSPYLKYFILHCKECGQIYLSFERVSNRDWRDDHDEYEEIKYKISGKRLMEILHGLKQR